MPTTISQIGCGYWGPNLLRAFSSLSGCAVKWVAEQSPDRRLYVERNFPRTRVTPDSNEALEDPEVAAVVICTPAATHHALAMAALRAGKHILVEKPLAMSTAQADELIDLAASRGLTLMAGHTFLYNPALRYLGQMVQAGELGKLFYVYSQRLNLGQVRSDVNSWWNLAPHDISILLYLRQGLLPESVTVQGVDYIQPGIEDVVVARLSWADRVVGHLHVSWLDPNKVRRITVVGSRKMVVYDDVSDDKIAIYDKGIDRIRDSSPAMDYDQAGRFKLLQRAGDVLLPKIDFEEPLKVEAAHFLECIEKRREPLTGPSHARDVVAILEAGQRSLAASGRTVPVEPRIPRRAPAGGPGQA